MPTDQTCRNCAFAAWTKTAKNRRTGEGLCSAEPIIKIPKSKEHGTITGSVRGWLRWSAPYTDCEFWEALPK
jgi:hypothetical protein